MKKRLGILLCAALPLTAAVAQDFKADFDKFRQGIMNDYNDFRRRVNEDYAKFLQEAWKECPASPFVPRPKEKELPPVVYEDDGQGEENRKDQQLPYDEVIPAPQPEPQPNPVEQTPTDPTPKPVVPTPPSPPTVKQLTFRLFGTAMQVREPGGERIRLKDAGETSVAEAWRVLSVKENEGFLTDCLELRRTHQLCDWAYLRLLQTIGECAYGAGSNEAVLVTAWLYCQSGYKMRLGRSDDMRLHMLYASRHAVFDMPYFKIGEERFYVCGTAPERMAIANLAFPNETPLSLLVPNQPLLTLSPQQGVKRSSERFPGMNYTIAPNKNLIDFYATYPSSTVGENFVSRWAMYANTPMSEDVKRQLYPALRKELEGCNQLEAVNKLLNWVQTGFEYKLDDEVWGEDRAFFAEETLFYPYSDCEDHSILFTRLVRDLVGLDCILIYYPGHLASAVEFTDTRISGGDHILLNGHKFLVADATYIGAPVGLTMKGMDNQTATVIKLQR